MIALALLLALLAFARPLDHDESQYVAAAALARDSAVYRDFAYLQTPLQPLLFAPFAALAGTWTFPALRIVNALLGTATTAFVYAATRTTGMGRPDALLAAGLFACCDAFLFSAAVARNDMLPACLLAAALWLMVRQAKGPATPAIAALIGLLLSAATAAKLSYAVPALAYGGLAMVDRRHRPAWLVLGAVPPAVLVVLTWSAAPDAFTFDVLRFPTAAPAQFYAAGRAWKLAIWVRGLDLVKFLALGPALLALGLVIRDRRRDAITIMLDLLIIAGLIAAILPAPTWRQYLLVMLPPLFVRAARAVAAVRPSAMWRWVAGGFVAAGLAPSLIALTIAALSRFPLLVAIHDGNALRHALDRRRISGPIATLSPQFVPATGRPIDPRFAAGPFFFRSIGLLPTTDEARLGLLSRATASTQLRARSPAAIVTGGEGPWTSGDAGLDAALAAAARAEGWRAVPVTDTPFTLHVPPP